MNILVKGWHERRRKKKIFRYLREYAAPKARERGHIIFSDKFYHEGLRRRCFKGMKLYAEVAGNKHYQRRLYEKINIQVD